jgi:hypothetical protein
VTVGVVDVFANPFGDSGRRLAAAVQIPVVGRILPARQEGILDDDLVQNITSFGSFVFMA